MGPKYTLDSVVAIVTIIFRFHDIIPQSFITVPNSRKTLRSMPLKQLLYFYLPLVVSGFITKRLFHTQDVLGLV